MNDKKQERARLVCELYESGYPVSKITKKANISLGTLYSILKKNGIELRSEQQQDSKNKAVEVICNYFDLGVSPEQIAEAIGTDTRNVILVLKKYRDKEFTKYLKRIKIQEAIDRKSENKALDPALANNPLQGMLAKQTKQNFDKDYKDLMLDANIQRALEGKKGITEDEELAKKIAHEYATGATIKEILSSYDVSQEYVFYLMEANNTPKN